MIPYDQFLHNQQAAAEIAMLSREVARYPFPKDWQINVARSSVVMTNPERSFTVKVDLDKRCLIDRGRGAAVKSKCIKCDSVALAWQQAKQALDRKLKPLPKDL